MSVNAMTQKPKRPSQLAEPAPVQTTKGEEHKPPGLLEAFGSYFSASEPSDVDSPSAQPSVRSSIPLAASWRAKRRIIWDGDGAGAFYRVYLQDVATLFGLKPDTELHDEFYCTSRGSLGRLYVFSSHIGFVDYFGSVASLQLIPVQVTPHGDALYIRVQSRTQCGS